MIVLLLALVFFPLCDPFPDHVPTTVCLSMHPRHANTHSQPLATSPYSVTVSSANYTPGAELTVTITGSTFNGFLIQARTEDPSKPPYPVGTFQDPLPLYTGHIWCSGGEPKNTVAHEHKIKVNFTSLSFKWTAPDVTAGNISFWATVVQNYTTFWERIHSSTLMGLAAPFSTTPPLDVDFQITKSGCGDTKGCYSEPSSCSSSQDCVFLVTYKDNGDNVTFELSSKLGYGAIGFNDKQAMNGTDTISCSTSATNIVEVRQYYLDEHQPIRYDLRRSSSDIAKHQGIYANGIVKCRFSRKKVPQGSRMRNLNTNWYWIFAWSTAGPTGVLAYHYANASYTPNTVDIRTPANLINGRNTRPAPTSSPDDKITKAECGKTKGCYSEPSNCQSSDDCQYLMTYEADKSNITFEISVKAGWGTVGFNTKNKMDGTDSIICFRASPSSSVTVAHYQIKGYNPPVKNVQSSSSLNVISGRYSGGSVLCRFSRLQIAPHMMDLSNKVFLVFARGSVTSAGSLNKHSHKSATLKAVDIRSTEKIDVHKKNLLILRAHAVLMSLAWLVCASLGMFVARYMKPVWGELMGLKTWFQVHRFLMLFTLLFTIIGIVLAFVYVDGWSEDYLAHSTIGIIVLLLSCVQPVMAFFRPAPGTENRFIFNWAHRAVGSSALILSIVNCFLGVYMPHFGIKDSGVYPITVYCMGVAIVIGLLEIVLRTAKNSFDVTPAPKAELKDGNVEVTTKQPVEEYRSGKPSKKNILFRTIVFGILVIVVSGVCLALIVILSSST